MKEIRPRGNGLRTVAAFAFGATAGSVIALLLAPASGQVTRRRLAMRLRNVQKEAARRLGQTRRALATRAEQVRETATEWIEDHLPHRNGNGRHVIRRKIRHATAH